MGTGALQHAPGGHAPSTLAGRRNGGRAGLAILDTMTEPAATEPAAPPPVPARDPDEQKMAVRVTGDRILCAGPSQGERRTRAGILIPATAKSADHRGVWAEVTEVGPLVRTIQSGDMVLVLPDALIEVDVRGDVFYIVRERDVHAVASAQRDAGSTGLYL
jgi:chaperonin GroES